MYQLLCTLLCIDVHFPVLNYRHHYFTALRLIVTCTMSYFQMSQKYRNTTCGYKTLLSLKRKRKHKISHVLLSKLSNRASTTAEGWIHKFAYTSKNRKIEKLETKHDIEEINERTPSIKYADTYSIRSCSCLYSSVCVCAVRAPCIQQSVVTHTWWSAGQGVCREDRTGSVRWKPDRP